MIDFLLAAVCFGTSGYVLWAFRASNTCNPRLIQLSWGIFGLAALVGCLMLTAHLRTADAPTELALLFRVSKVTLLLVSGVVVAGVLKHDPRTPTSGDCPPSQKKA